MWRLERGDSGTDSGYMEPVCLTKSLCHVCSVSALSLSVPACPNFNPHGSLTYNDGSAEGRAVASGTGPGARTGGDSRYTARRD